MIKQNCLNCKFFRSEYAGYGDCRRYPPSVCCDPNPDTTQSILAIFPHVPEKDWCGEFVKKELNKLDQMKNIIQEQKNKYDRCCKNNDSYQIMQDELRANILENIDRIFRTSQD
jgi:hypothetical protein